MFIVVLVIMGWMPWADAALELCIQSDNEPETSAGAELSFFSAPLG